VDLNPNQHIFDVLQAIDRGTYRVPSIQRGYEWGPDRVTKLLDSIMSGYPIGAIMVWRPDNKIRADIPSRRFINKFESSLDYLSGEPHPAEGEAYLVLDGQQRLQSMYLSFFGSYDGRRVYLQLDHIPTDVDDDTDYRFEFLTLEEGRERPEMIHLSDIIQLDSDTQFEFVENLVRRLCEGISDDTKRQQKRANINRNIDRFRERFNMKTSLLFQEVERRHNYDHVLEIFERVNSGGMVLDKSDLLFSTLKLKLWEMEQKFTEAVNFLNQGNRHNFNTDFLIKASLVIFDQKAKYEVSKLRGEEFIKMLREKFEELNYCLRQMYAWLDDMALIKCDRFLRSRLALIPILDYMMLSGNRDRPDGDNGNAMRQYIYMAFVLRLFSRAPDSVLDQIHDRLVEAVKKDPRTFPIQTLREFIAQRQKVLYRLEPHHFNDDADLMLNIVDGGVLQIDPVDPTRHPKDLKLEIDHIFPRSKLQDAGLGDIADHLGNYRLIVMPANRRKLAKMPDARTAFYGRNNLRLEPLYQRALGDMNRDNFLAFRDARAELIRQDVEAFLGLSIVTEA
jgi:uncharacterized protein with ParB-like and HNH nuclease domain